MRISWLLLVMSLTMPLTGCGQKGALVLPDTQHPHKRIGLPKPPAAPTPAPADPKPMAGSETSPSSSSTP